MQRTGAAKGCGAKIARSEAKCKTRKSDMSVRAHKAHKAHKAPLIIRITRDIVPTATLMPLFPTNIVCEAGVDHE